MGPLGVHELRCLPATQSGGRRHVRQAGPALRACGPTSAASGCFSGSFCLTSQDWRPFWEDRTDSRAGGAARPRLRGSSTRPRSEEQVGGGGVGTQGAPGPSSRGQAGGCSLRCPRPGPHGGQMRFPLPGEGAGAEQRCSIRVVRRGRARVGGPLLHLEPGPRAGPEPHSGPAPGADPRSLHNAPPGP